MERRGGLGEGKGIERRTGDTEKEKRLGKGRGLREGQG